MLWDLFQLFNNEPDIYNTIISEDKPPEKKNGKKHVRFYNIVYVVLIPTLHEYAAFRNKVWS